MLSTILITFIYCGPNKWNNQRPLIDTASGSWGCMGVLKGRSGKRPESPLESCAVINERRTGTNYTHRPNQKEIHTLTHTHTHMQMHKHMQMHTVYLCQLPSLRLPCLSHSLFCSIHFYHSDGSDSAYGKINASSLL